MRFFTATLIVVVGLTAPPGVNAEDVAWNVSAPSDTAFARLSAVRGGAEVLSLVCVRSGVTDAEFKGSGILSAVILPTMIKNNSLAILIRDDPAAGNSARMYLDYLHKGRTLTGTPMRYVDDFGAFFAELRPDYGLIDLLMQTTALRFKKGGANTQSVEVDFTGVFHNELASMAASHCHSGVANAIGVSIEPPPPAFVAERGHWEAPAGWSSRKGAFFVLRHRGENGSVTRLWDGAGRASATLTTLGDDLTPSLYDDFLIDSGNRYFFRAPRDANADTVGAMTHDGRLVLLTMEDDLADSFKDAAALKDGWVLSAGGLFHLSASDELSDLSATPASGKFPADLSSVDNRVIYVDKHPEFGVELFATDGTVKGTGMVVDINQKVYGQGRTRDSSPMLEHAERVGDRIVFTASDSSIPSAMARYNYHIWSSDGTAEGTLRLPTDGFYSYFSNFIEFEGRLYVTARPRGNGDNVLYSTDGTAAGTRALASDRSLIKLAGGDPERNRAFLGEPTRVGSRLIVPLLGSPLGRERGNPVFEVSPSGTVKQLSVTSEPIGDLAGRLRGTGVSAGGMLLFSGVARKKSTTFQGFYVSSVIRSVNPDSGETDILHELQSGEKVDWLPNTPQRLPAVDAVVFGTRKGPYRNLIVTDGTVAGTRALSQGSATGESPRIAAFAVGDRRIAWMERDVFYALDPSQGKVMTLFDPEAKEASRPNSAILGTVRLH